MSEIYGKITLNADEIRRSRSNRGSFVRCLNREMQSVVRAFALVSDPLPRWWPERAWKAWRWTWKGRHPFLALRVARLRHEVPLGLWKALHDDDGYRGT